MPLARKLPFQGGWGATLKVIEIQQVTKPPLGGLGVKSHGRIENKVKKEAVPFETASL